MKPVVVVGGINMDIKGRSKEPLVHRSSNPGKLEMAPGGVGRNIAHNLARLRVPVTLLGVVGEDYQGRQVLERTVEAGVNIEHVLQLKGRNTGTYLALLNCDGEMELALSDMQITESMDQHYLNGQSDVLQSAGFIVCDTNIPKECIRFLIRYANAAGIPICVEPVSVSKAVRIADILNGIDYITPNKDELGALSGLPSEDAGLEAAAQALIKGGIRNVLVTLGEKGMCLVNSEGSSFFQSLRVRVADVTGAGDALTAGFIYGMMKYGDPLMACKCGLAAAAITVESNETVSGSMSETALLERLEWRK